MTHESFLIRPHAMEIAASNSPELPQDFFGGQPCWIDLPQWPVCSGGSPMVFIGQLNLSNILTPRLNIESSAYIFHDIENFRSKHTRHQADGIIVVQRSPSLEPLEDKFRFERKDEGPSISTFASSGKFRSVRYNISLAQPKENQEGVGSVNLIGSNGSWEELDDIKNERNVDPGELCFFFQLSPDALPFAPPFEGLLFGFLSNDLSYGVTYDYCDF